MSKVKNNTEKRAAKWFAFLLVIILTFTASLFLGSLFVPAMHQYLPIIAILWLGELFFGTFIVVVLDDDGGPMITIVTKTTITRTGYWPE